MNSHQIIRTCRHVLTDGRHCQGASVRGRTTCRHHLDARTRLHNMARAQRRSVILRWRVPDSRRDLARNRAEVNRVVATGRLDFETARMLFWAMDLTAATFPAARPARSNRAHNLNVSYHVPVNPLFAGGCVKNHSQVPENTWRKGEGVPAHPVASRPNSRHSGAHARRGPFVARQPRSTRAAGTSPRRRLGGSGGSRPLSL